MASAIIILISRCGSVEDCWAKELKEEETSEEAEDSHMFEIALLAAWRETFCNIYHFLARKPRKETMCTAHETHPSAISYVLLLFRPD